MKLSIKNMVCPRCIASVEDLLRKQGINARSVRLGEADLEENLDANKLDELSKGLSVLGFELLDDQKKQILEQVKNTLIQKVQSGEIEEHFGISKFIISAIHRDYSYVSKLFSEVEGVTLEQFFILQKIEKAKEWLIYNEYSLSEISFRLGYSSAQHLSTQFKRVTGMTPSQFKIKGAPLRKSLDSLI